MHRIKKLSYAFICVVLFTAPYVNAERIDVSNTVEYSDAMSYLTSKNSQDNMLMTAETENQYSLNRLIVISDTALPECDQSDSVVYNDNLYILFFDDKNKTDAAYKKLTERDDICVVHDMILNISETEGSLAEEEKKEYISWAPEYIGLNLFNEGLLNKYGNVLSMPEIKVAVADTGVDYNHEFLQGRIDIENGYDFVNNDTDPMDDHSGSHGTHVSGIICDGTFENVKIIPYKTMDELGRGSISNMVAALKAAEETGADVMNFSLGGAMSRINVDDDVYKLFERVLEDDKMIITSAVGNIAATASPEPYFPACVDGVIGVGNCKDDGSICETSNHGNFTDFAAPGFSIYSTLSNNKYGTKTGTSMSCPVMSAAVAALKTVNKEYTYNDIEELLKMSAIDGGEEGYDEFFGYGILNLNALADLSFADKASDPLELISADIDEENGILDVEIKNLSDQDITSELFAVYTDTNGITIGLTKTDFAIKVSEIKGISFEIPDDLINSEKNIKLLFWTNDGKMKPVNNAILVPEIT